VARHQRGLLPIVVSLATVVVVYGCGGSQEPSGAAAHVSRFEITKAAVAHRIALIKLGDSGRTSQAESASLRAQAMSYLITAQWVIQEPPSEWRTVSRGEVSRRLAERERSLFPNGESEYREYLKQTGMRPSDLRLEVEVELARAKLHEGIEKSLYPPNASDVAAYYRAHRREFGLPETREVWIIDRKSRAAAAAVMRRVQSGVPFLSLARTEIATGPHGMGGYPPLSPLEAAIDKAQPHTLVGPVKYKADYLVFELKRIVPARYESLRQVAAKIKQKLTAKRHRMALERFVKEWRSRWSVKTECEPGYVVPKCANYVASPVREDPLAIQ
jgi:PPIC-type PPIASE domain/SurA N-terminal domain